MRLIRPHPLISPYASFHRLRQYLSHNHLTEIFRLPYEIFVDALPGQMLYCTLGMGHIPTGTQKVRCLTNHSVGTYVRHGSVSRLAMVIAHVLRVGMPVWERGRDASQLGGEFVLGLRYTYFFFVFASDI
jgi:hypothetical protein